MKCKHQYPCLGNFTLTEESGWLQSMLQIFGYDLQLNQKHVQLMEKNINMLINIFHMREILV